MIRIPIAKSSFALLLALLSGHLMASEFQKVPKQYSVETGYRYVFSNSFGLAPHGTTFLFDYGWQLSGFSGKPPAYITVPLGYTFLYGTEGQSNGRILSYGWTIKHNLKGTNKLVPFLGYGLLLNQLSIEGTEGKVFGHQTRFDFGYIYKQTLRWNPFVKLEYSITRYPSLGKRKADQIHAAEVKLGVNF